MSPTRWRRCARGGPGSAERPGRPSGQALTASGLERFVEAQASAYPQALAELRAGTKQSHWMWFVFPQIAGLGFSPMAQFYAIGSLDEARAYLAHPLLGARLKEATEAVLAQRGRSAAA